MVDALRCQGAEKLLYWRRVAGMMAMVLLLCWLPAGVMLAQQPGVHYLHQGVMPPGAIGTVQLQRGGPLPGFFQPVQIKALRGALISLAIEGDFARPQKAPLRVGMLIGRVYRLRIVGIPLAPGLEVFPTVEIIDRLYTPPSQQQRFAIPVELTLEDLRLALDGKFVTRVIYLENPRAALPVREDPQSQGWFEASPGRDPLAMADELGRPVAILRLGARLPGHGTGPDMQFLFGCPPLVQYPPRSEAPPPKERPPKEITPEKAVPEAPREP